MAERDLIGEALDIIASAGQPGSDAVAAPHFTDPLVDAFSIASGPGHQRVRPPDARVERQLRPADAVAAASGLMIAPVSLTHRWWKSMPGPVVAGLPDQPIALVPDGSRAMAIEPITRRRSRAGRGTRPAGDAVVITAALPASESWVRLVGWSLRSYGASLRLLLLFALIGGLAGLLLPLATAALFSYAVPWGDIATAVGILVPFAVASVGAAIVFFARNLMVIRLRDASDAILSPGIMAHTLRLPVTFFRRTSAGDVLNRVLSVEQARAAVGDGVPALILTSAFGIVNLVFLLVISPALGLTLTATVAVIMSASVLLQVRARASLQRLLESRSQSDSMLMSLAHAIVPIRVSGTESRALAQWATLQAEALAALLIRMQRLDRGHPAAVLGPLLVNAVLVITVLAIGDSFTSSDFMPVYAAVVQLTVAMTIVSTNIVLLWEIGPVLSRALPITTTPVERPGARRAPGPLGGEITLTDVVFGYDRDSPPLVDGLSLTVSPGEFVAIVGPSGSGKSTLLRLILGYEVPWSGVVAFDGQDLADLDVTAVRRQLGTVLQSSAPFGATYRECICGPLEVPDDVLWQVLARSGLDDDVRGQVAGLDAVVGDSGAGISGGQRQRLMIARALAADPRIVLLDEATSALDNVTQEIVMRAMLGMSVTRVAIAHRLSTVEKADRILVVDGGRIVEEGSAAHLLRLDGHFARLAARQEI